MGEAWRREIEKSIEKGDKRYEQQKQDKKTIENQLQEIKKRVTIKR